MFLPALLIRDLGLWGYVVFAVPNVVGAAAMGWVLKSPESSRRLVEWHKPAAIFFSTVTILFHYYWIAWLFSWATHKIQLSPWIWAFVILSILLNGSILGRFTPLQKLRATGVRRYQLLAFATWTVSAILLISLVATDPLTPAPAQVFREIPFTMDAVWLLPASLFGFLLCPYLDLTFHRARLNCDSPRDSKWSFGAGFGIFFFSMIVLTVLYAGPIAALTDREFYAPVSIARWAAWLIAIHIGVQTLFTVHVHEDERHRRLGAKRTQTSWAGIGLILVAILGWLIGKQSGSERFLFDSLNMISGEIIYRLFLTFYGLIFPTYVYLNIWDVRQRALRRHTRRSLTVTLIAIAIASPFFFMGFFVRDERYIPFGVAILLAAKLFTGRDDRPAPIARPA